MGNSTTNLDQISSTQANKELVMNALVDAASPATLWGRQASTTSGLTWGYYGGCYVSQAGAQQIANGTLTLTASTTNYVYASSSTGAVSVNTTGFPTSGAIPLYTIITGTSTASSYTDQRGFLPGATQLTTALAQLTDVQLPTAASFSMSTNTAASPSAYAFKGNVVKASQTLFVNSVYSYGLNTVGGQTYVAMIAPANTSTTTISGTPVFSASYTPAGSISNDPHVFAFSAPVQLNSGSDYIIAVGCTSGAGTYALPIGAATSGSIPSNPYFTTDPIFRIASTAPANGNTYDTSGGNTIPYSIAVNMTLGTALINGQALVYNSAISKWQNVTLTIAAMGDAGITSPEYGESLMYNGSDWTNARPLSGRNGFIDGNFDSWQGGTSFSLGSGAYQYTADMWIAGTASGAAATVSQQMATVGSEPVGMTTPRRYKLRYAMTTAGGGMLSQRKEGVASYNGRSVTVSVYLQALAAGTLVTGVTYVQNFGTGGSPSANVSAAMPVAWAVGTTESRFGVRLDIPSIAGKTLGTDGNDFLEIQLNLASGGTYTLDFSEMQIEECNPAASPITTGSGGAPTPFEYFGLEETTARVGRYLAVFSGTPASGAPWDGLYIGWGHAVTSANPGDVRATTKLPQKMRSIPAVTLLGAPTVYLLSGQTSISAAAVSVSGVFDGFNLRLALFNCNSSTVSIGFNGALILGGVTTQVSAIFDARL